MMLPMQKLIAPTGIVPSLNTPFNEEGNLDEASLRRLVEHTIGSGCTGMLAIAVAGEHASLSFEEKARIIDILVAQNGHRIPLIVNVTSPEIGQSVQLATLARDAGAEGICCQAPARLKGIGLKRALASIADAGPDFLMIQDLDWVGGGLDADDILFLYEKIPSFQSLKIETVPAGPKYSRVISDTEGHLNVCGGWAVSQFMDALQRGVHAFIPTAMEPIYIAIYKLYMSEETEEARSLFYRLLPVLAFSNQHIEISIRFFKELRKAEGIFTSGYCRPPVAPFDEVQALECKRAITLVQEIQREISLIEGASR